MKSKTRFTTRLGNLGPFVVGDMIPVRIGSDTVQCKIISVSGPDAYDLYDIELEGHIEQDLVKGVSISAKI